MGISHCAIVNAHALARVTSICDTSPFVLEAFKKYSEFASINVRYLSCIRHPSDLEPYISRSGYSTSEEWIAHIKDGLPAHIYEVTINGPR
jgi:hypothetical protein